MKGLTFLELSFLEGRRRLRTLSPPLPLPLLGHSQLEFVLVNADPESLLNTMLAPPFIYVRFESGLEIP